MNFCWSWLALARHRFLDDWTLKLIWTLRRLSWNPSLCIYFTGSHCSLFLPVLSFCFLFQSFLLILFPFLIWLDPWGILCNMLFLLAFITSVLLVILWFFKHCHFFLSFLICLLSDLKSISSRPMRFPILFNISILFSCQNFVKPSMPITINVTSIDWINIYEYKFLKL